MICRIQAGSPSLPEKCFKKLLTKGMCSYIVSKVNIEQEIAGSDSGLPPRRSRRAGNTGVVAVSSSVTSVPSVVQVRSSTASWQRQTRVQPRRGLSHQVKASRSDFFRPTKRSNRCNRLPMKSLPIKPPPNGLSVRNSAKIAKRTHSPCPRQTMQVLELELVAYNPPRLPVKLDQSNFRKPQAIRNVLLLGRCRGANQFLCNLCFSLSSTGLWRRGLGRGGCFFDGRFMGRRRFLGTPLPVPLPVPLPACAGRGDSNRHLFAKTLPKTDLQPRCSRALFLC
jgi:hypothetical protein